MISCLFILFRAKIQGKKIDTYQRKQYPRIIMIMLDPVSEFTYQCSQSISCME